MSMRTFSTRCWLLKEVLQSNINNDDEDCDNDDNDDGNLLHKVVAVVLQFAHEVPSRRDEDWRNTCFKSLIE